jgi:hypothetical protein
MVAENWGMARTPFTRQLCPGILLAALFCTGCEAIPVSQHPLSDETNSEIDPALIGMWDVINEEQEAEAKEEPAGASTDKPARDEKPEPAADPERPPRFGIGKLAGKERSMELVSMQLTDDHIEIKRQPFHISPGKQQVISIPANPEELGSDFILLRYEIVNENRILVHFLSCDVIVKSIQRGELKGVVRKAAPKDPNNPNEEQRKEQIRITASPQELRDYLAKNEKTAFEAKPLWRLQRAAAN